MVRLSHWLEHRPDVLSNMAANTEKLHDLILNEFANARIRAARSFPVQPSSSCCSAATA